MSRPWKRNVQRAECLRYDNAHTILQIRAKNPEQREMVAGHMAHLPSTQETHYINRFQCDESVVAFEAIQSLYVRLQPQRNKCFCVCQKC